MIKKAITFMKKNPVYHAAVHSLGGIGIGILIAHPIAGAHPVRFGVAFLIIAILGHIFAAFA